MTTRWRSIVHLREARQVNKGEVKDVRAIDAEMNGELADALILSSNAKRLCLNLFAYFAKIREAFVDVKKLGPFCVGRRVG